MGIALFRAGDYEASVLELRKYLGSFPEDDEAQGLLREAEKRARGGERPRAAGAADPAEPPVATAADPAEPPVATAADPAEPPVATAADQAAAQDLYERGVRVYRQDIGEAIRLWEQGLERDPHHVQTRLRLEQARKMQQRLEAIDRQ
jgi:tetratricopeptide (TPR) repeat protein